MSIHAIAADVPSRFTATAGASMGQPPTPVGASFISFGGVNDLPPSFDPANQIGRFSRVAPSLQARSTPVSRAAIPGAQHSHRVEATLTFFPGLPSTTLA